MAVFSKESLEILRGKIDLVEVISSHVKMGRSGAYYKACCPFHNEKSPSFMIQKGDSHYHCFGCGAHGDAIAFAMNYLHLSFVEAVEMLAERFNVPLERIEGEKKGPDTSLFKKALDQAADFYHFYLLYSDEGHQALKYLYNRGLDLEFIRTFRIGYAPRKFETFTSVMREMKFHDDVLKASGLLAERKNGLMPFFSERVMIPITDRTGNVLGFSGRKISEKVFGGKYINSPETILFKKSKTLFGIKESRVRIAREQKAIVVEGQIDCLRLIQAGFNFTVAGQGTAFGEEQVSELIQLGAKHVYLAFDGDSAGKDAAEKVGNLFQKEGIEISIICFKEGEDPDTILNEKGPPGIVEAMTRAMDYLPFLAQKFGESHNIHTPAGKNEMVQFISSKIRDWEHPLMVHEGLKKLADICGVPESVIAPKKGSAETPFIQRSASVHELHIDPDRILETDLLRLLLLQGEETATMALNNLTAEDFRVSICHRLFASIKEIHGRGEVIDLLNVASELDDAEQQQFLSEILKKKIHPDRIKDSLGEVVKKILERNWLLKREEIKGKIQSGRYSEEEVLDLAKEFDAIKSKPPQVILQC